MSHEQLGALAQKYLSGVSAQYTLGIPAATPSRYTGSELRMRDDDVPLAYMAFAVQGCAATSPDYVPLLVARDYVGRWERSSGGGHHHASKLVQALVDYDNRALSFNSFNLSYSDTGLWSARALSCANSVARLNLMNLCALYLGVSSLWPTASESTTQSLKSRRTGA